MRKKRRNKQQWFSLRWGGFWQWLVPGMGVKRWLIFILFGVTLVGVGFAVIILDVYRSSPETWWLPLLSAASLRFLERPIRALIFGLLGASLILGGIWGLNHSLLAPFRRPGKPFVNELAVHRRRERGPKIVALGGGHGLSALLRGLKTYTYNITAVVSVADDGGSSGKLRRVMGILPPGDIRNCLSALSDDETLLAQLFQYRFPDGEGGLEGHSFGNLFITALAEITGSFEDAVAESGRVLAVHGCVLPATLEDIRIVADMVPPLSIREYRIEGESKIPRFTGQVSRVWIEPNNPHAYPKVIQALLSADLIIIGPGSLYTSIMPNLLVPEIAAAIQSSRAFKIFVCNVATQPGETDGFSCGEHVRALSDHVGTTLFDVVLTNSNTSSNLPEGMDWVLSEEELDTDYVIKQVDLIDMEKPYWHDPQKLANVIMDLYQERTGPLVE